MKKFFGPADIPTIFQEKIDRTLGHQTSVWLDDITVVTRGTKEEHTRKLYSVLTKLENEGYRARKKKNQNSTKKKQFSSNIQYRETESDQTKKKPMR